MSLRRLRDLARFLREQEQLLAISISTVLVMAGQGVIGPVLPLFAKELGVGAGEIGLTLSIFARLVPGASQAVLVRLRDKAPDLALQAESIENMLGVRPPYQSSSGVWGDSKFA